MSQSHVKNVAKSKLNIQHNWEPILWIFEIAGSFVLSNKQNYVYNDQPLGKTALGKIGGGYGSLVSMVALNSLLESLVT